MRPLGKWILTTILLLAGSAMLAFTACGLFFGLVGFVRPGEGGLGVALIGLMCAAIGAGLTYEIFKGWRRLWPSARPLDSIAQEPSPPSEDKRP